MKSISIFSHIRFIFAVAWVFGLLFVPGLGEGYSVSSQPDTVMDAMPSRINIVQMGDGDSNQDVARKYTIADCFKLALKQSEAVAIKKEEIEKATALLLEASSYGLGDVNFMITNFWQDAPSGDAGGGALASSFAKRETRERKFVYRQPVFQGFRALGALMGAGSLKKQRKEEWIRAEQLLLLDVASAFYNVLQTKRDIEITQQILTSYQSRIQELEEREKIGRSRLSEVMTVRAAMKMAEADLTGYRGALSIEEYVLEFLTGIVIRFDQLVDTTAEKDMARTVEEYLALIDNRPDVRAARQAVKTARQGIVVAQSGFWPQISLEGNNYVHREGFQKDFDWDALFKIDIPLFEGFENAGKLKGAVSEWKQAKLQLQLTERQAVLEIKKAFESWMTARRRYASLQEASDTSEKNYNLEKEEYARNLVSNLDVLQALNSLLSSRRQTNQAFYRSKLETWQLRVAVGETI